MEKHENALYHHLSEWRIADAYAKPFENQKVLTNINELFRTSAKDEVLRLFFCDEKYLHPLISDFEYFADFCRLLPSLAGTLVGELAEEEIQILCGNSIEYPRAYLDEKIVSLWENGNKNLTDIRGNYLDFLSNFDVEKLYQRETLLNTFGCVEKCYHQGENCFAVADLSHIPFVRPNPYHANLAKEALAEGNPVSEEEKAILIFQALYEILCASSKSISCLRLIPDADGKTARDFIEYLKRMGVSLSIRIAADGSVREETLVSLYALSDAQLDITLELVLGAADSQLSLYRRLCRLSALFPLSHLRFGGVRTDAPLFFAGHRHFLRVLSRLLLEITPNGEEAERLGMQILGVSH